jgi:hypothetical protein
LQEKNGIEQKNLYMQNLSQRERVKKRWSSFLKACRLTTGRGGGLTRLDGLLKKIPNRSGSYRSGRAEDELSKYLDGGRAVKAERAFQIGEALREFEIDGKRCAWCSGPVGLYAAGLLGDFVGLLGALAAWDDSQEGTALLGHRWAARWAYLARTASGVSERFFILPDRIKEARETLSKETCPAPLLNSAWKACKKKPLPVPGYMSHVRAAFAIANDNEMDFGEREYWVQRLLDSWFQQFGSLHGEIQLCRPLSLLNRLHRGKIIKVTRTRSIPTLQHARFRGFQ